jgi:signal transduction histidine kinase
MLALIAESNRLYGRLALSTAARKREREARLMSMDAVTAAIAHEVGQPLTAASLSASAALNWLTQPRPDISKAITSLRAISEDTRRTFDVIRSIRAMFGKGGGPVTVFSLNDLVRETVSVMDRELAGAKVSLELALDESLPPIRADRVQIQRVLINLVTNAVESLAAIHGRTRLLSQSRPRRITIRSVSLNGQGVQLDVSDTGSGIPSEELEHIFDPFYTTKASGTGLGLPLCRTIVEDHHGRLWASQGEESGAIFHLELPCSLAALNETSSPST